MVWALVQSRSADLGAIVGTTATLAFLSNVTAGNLIVAAFTRGSNVDVVTGVADTPVNTYSRASSGWQVDANASQGLWVYYAGNINGGPCAVAFTFTFGNADYNAMAIHEYSGGAAAPFDVGSGQFDSTGSTATD